MDFYPDFYPLLDNIPTRSISSSSATQALPLNSDISSGTQTLQRSNINADNDYMMVESKLLSQEGEGSTQMSRVSQSKLGGRAAADSNHHSMGHSRAIAEDSNQHSMEGSRAIADMDKADKADKLDKAEEVDKAELKRRAQVRAMAAMQRSAAKFNMQMQMQIVEDEGDDTAKGQTEGKGERKSKSKSKENDHDDDLDGGRSSGGSRVGVGVEVGVGFSVAVPSVSGQFQKLNLIFMGYVHLQFRIVLVYWSIEWLIFSFIVFKIKVYFLF